jgi:hypothetical protein
MALAIALILIVALAVYLIRFTRTDGGPHPTPPERLEDSWHTEVPTHPYSEHPHA